MPIPEWMEKWIDKLDEENIAPIPVEPRQTTWGSSLPHNPELWTHDPSPCTMDDLERPFAPLDTSEE